MFFQREGIPTKKQAEEKNGVTIAVVVGMDVNRSTSRPWLQRRDGGRQRGEVRFSEISTITYEHGDSSRFNYNPSVAACRAALPRTRGEEAPVPLEGDEKPRLTNRQTDRRISAKRWIRNSHEASSSDAFIRCQRSSIFVCTHVASCSEKEGLRKRFPTSR